MKTCIPQMKNQSARGAEVASAAGAIEMNKERGVAIASVANAKGKANSCQRKYAIGYQVHAALDDDNVILRNAVPEKINRAGRRCMREDVHSTCRQWDNSNAP